MNQPQREQNQLQHDWMETAALKENVIKKHMEMVFDFFHLKGQPYNLVPPFPNIYYFLNIFREMLVEILVHINILQ